MPTDQDSLDLVAHTDRRPEVDYGREPYRKPLLRSLGDLRAMTLGTSRGAIESGSSRTFRR
jgi:hypothetical protein